MDRLVCTLMACTVPCLLVGAPSATAGTVFSPDAVIVQWEDGSSHGERVAARADAEVEFLADLGNREFQLVEVDGGQTPAAAIAALEDDPSVVLAERDGYRSPDAIPDDPLFGELWGLKNLGTGIDGFSGATAGADIDVEGAWLRNVGTPSTVVAVIDSGYQFEHPELANVAWTNPGEVPGNAVDDDANGFVDDVHGWDFVGANGEAPVADADPSDDDLLSGGHGVHTAGTIGAEGDNGVGISGVAQDVRLMPLRVCTRFPSISANRCPFSADVAAINYAGKMGARVANMSLGGTTRSQAEANALAANPGTLYVISAGNDGVSNETTHHYPCDFNPTVDASPAVPGAIDNVVCVAATNQADELATFSDWGSISVDLGAPGTETLSTYPLTFPYEEDFSFNNFAAEWPSTGADGGFERTNQSPLASFGMTDRVGAPTPSTVRETTSQPFTLPPNTGCVLFQTRRVELAAGDQYRYAVLLDGVEQAVSTPAKTASAGLEIRILELPAAFKAGGSVQLRFRFTAGASATASSGVWLDDLRLRCRIPTYAFLQGTSMAAPHVAGAAALLFSQDPAASVAAVKKALLGGVDPTPSLTGKTVTGGRLNASGAMDFFDKDAPQAPLLTETSPTSPAKESLPRIVGSAEPGSTVRIYKGPACAGSPTATGSAAQLASPGIQVSVPAETTSQFSATATDSAKNASACSAPISYTNTAQIGPSTVTLILPPSPPAPPPAPPGCKVPKLAGKTLAQAKTALTATGCKLGKVTKPRPQKGQKLVVKTTTPVAGTVTTAAVAVKLGPKPKPKRH